MSAAVYAALFFFRKYDTLMVIGQGKRFFPYPLRYNSQFTAKLVFASAIARGFHRNWRHIMSEHTKINYLKESSESKQQLAYEQIKKDILNNTYPEGTVLVERRLCEIYNMSRSPIRNALWQLTYEGLLNYIPGKGAAVAGFTIEDILEVYDLIETLQIYAARTLLFKNSPYTMEGLEKCLSSMKENLDRENILESNRWDQKFHQLLIEASANKRLKTIYSQLLVQSQRFIATTLSDKALSSRSYSEHISIFAAIRARDMAAVENEIRRHYKNIKQYYVNRLLDRVNL